MRNSQQMRAATSSPHAYRGSASVSAAMLLLALALVAGAFAMQIRDSQIRLRSGAASAQQELLLTEISRVIVGEFGQLLDHAFEQNELPSDAELSQKLELRVREQLQSHGNVALDSLSFALGVRAMDSGININLVPEELLRSPQLSQYFVSPSAIEEILSSRERRNLFSDISQYRNLLSDEGEPSSNETWVSQGSALISHYSFIYPGQSDSGQASAMLESRLGMEGNGQFEEMLEQVNRTTTASASEQQARFDELLRSQPQFASLLRSTGRYDVNRIDENLLRAVLSLDFGSGQIPELMNAADRIIQLRERQFIGERLLRDLLNLDQITETHPEAEGIMRYFGAWSCFWELRIAVSDMRQSMIVVQLENEDSLPVLQLLSYAIQPSNSP